MELLKSYLNKDVMVMLSNEAASMPITLGGVNSVGFQEIEGKLTGYDDTGAVEVQAEGVIYVLNWTWVVGIAVTP